jgi:hypothetical protein
VTDGELRVGKGIADFQLDPPDFVENELELLSPSKQQQIHDKLEGMEGPSKPGHGFPYQQRKEPIQSPLCAGRPRRGENDEGREDGWPPERRRHTRGGVLRFGGPAGPQACACSPSQVYGLGRWGNGVVCENELCAWASLHSLLPSGFPIRFFLKRPIRLLRKEKKTLIGLI